MSDFKLGIVRLGRVAGKVRRSDGGGGHVRPAEGRPVLLLLVVVVASQPSP